LIIQHGVKDSTLGRFRSAKPEGAGMHPGDDWISTREERVWRAGDAGVGAVRIALLFGFVAVAFAMMIVPVANKRSREWSARMDGIDRIETGAVERRETYTIRRSVLQASPTSECTIRSNGERSGEC
jgi:hypothetical protein